MTPAEAARIERINKKPRNVRVLIGHNELGQLTGEGINRTRATDVIEQPNYNDEPSPAVTATIRKIVDTSKVIELERIDADALPKRYVYRFIKRLFDIVSCLLALALCAIPMLIIAILIKCDSPGPVFYRQERVRPSILGECLDLAHNRRLSWDNNCSLKSSANGVMRMGQVMAA